MAAPVRPSQFAALIVQPEDSLAVAIIKTYVKLPILVFKLANYIFNSDGSFTQQFRADLCAIQCPTTPATITT